MEGHVDVPSQSPKDPGELGASGSSPSYLLSWFPARRPPSSCPNTGHCLKICVTLTEELGAVPLPSHAWTVPLVEDMLCYARTGLTEVVVTGPGRAVHFYGRHSLGEGLSLGKVRDATFLLTRSGPWVGKSAYLVADPLTIQEGQQAITQAITKCQIKARGPGHLHMNLLTPQPFRFDCPRGSSQKDSPGDANSNHQPMPHQPLRGQGCNRCRRDQRQPPLQLPLPSPDHRSESDRSSLSTASSMSSISDRLEGSWYSWHGR